MIQIAMKRIFNPVGEGSFCIERFTAGGEGHCFVFDCGSSTSLNMKEGTSLLVSRELDFNFDGEEVIDAVFISHFDREHMNGLEELLRKHPVRKLFLPKLGREDMALMSLKIRFEFSNESSGFVQMLVSHPLDLVFENKYDIGQVVLVEALGGMETDVRRNVLEFNRVPENIPSGTLIQCSLGTELVLWEFLLVNFREENRIQRLKREFHKKKLPLPKDAGDASRLWDSRYKEIVAIFMEDLMEDFNTNALVVYSGKRTDRFEAEMRPVQSGKSFGNCRSFFKVRSGCMYMGDFSLEKRPQWYRLKEIYEEEWDEISVWQLPHHGAAKHFRHEVAVHGAEIYIVCAGTANTFQHPGRTVVRKLELTGKKVYWVDEEPENRVVFLYEFSSVEA